MAIEAHSPSDHAGGTFYGDNSAEEMTLKTANTPVSKRKRDECEITEMPPSKQKRVYKTPEITDEPTPEYIVTVEQEAEEAVVEDQVEDTEVPTDQRVANLKGGADPIMEVSTEEPRADLKGAPTPTDNPRANFKGAPIPTEPPQAKATSVNPEMQPSMGARGPAE